MDHVLARLVGADDRDVCAVFIDDLAADAAGRDFRVCGVGDGDGFDAAMPLREGGGDGAAFSADCCAKAGVFDVGTTNDCATFHQDCRANGEVGIGRVGPRIAALASDFRDWICASVRVIGLAFGFWCRLD